LEIMPKTPSAVMALGATLQPAGADEMRRLGIRNGLKVTELNNGKLKSAGVREGFIIVRVDRKEVKGLQDVIKILDQKSDAVLIEGIYPNGITAYYGFGM